MNIAVAFNYHNEEKYGLVSNEFDSPETMTIVRKAIESAGHRVVFIEADVDFYPRLKALKDLGEVDLVFNYSVGIYGRGREVHVPAICEMLRVPFGSSDTLATAFCQDKARAKDIMNFHGIKAPDYQLFFSPEDRLTKKINYPVIVKYVYQGSSIGLTDNRGVVMNDEELLARVKFLYETFPQTIMAEEYIGGREFTVGFYGNLPAVTFFPLVEILPTPCQSKNVWVFNSHKQPVATNIPIAQEIKDEIYAACRAIVEIFELKDWGRIDLRVNEKDNHPYIIEINNCAHLSSVSVYHEGAVAIGISHDELIINMLNAALKRNNLLK